MVKGIVVQNYRCHMGCNDTVLNAQGRFLTDD
jgi:hypothetical protein